MSAPLHDPSGELSPIKRALLEIRELRARIAAFEAAAAEPIAVVGLGCRLPGGVADEDSLWTVLRDGVDTIREIPADRWDIDALYDADPDRAGRMSTREGGFLDSVDQFDAAFFGIAPREAASMDPQQRLLLEVCWEALENAGIAPNRLGGSPTGVFVGAGNNDYGRMLFSDRNAIDAYAGSGSSLSVIAGRVSYILGLQGPSLVVDTACSSSLVSVHLAVQSLRRAECDLALAGGVNLILSPDAHITFTKARMMAVDGRCKTFDAAADGYGRGEGCAVVVLRRLSDARARGERVLALIRGSAINQDGRSGGLTAPNGPAQEAVIRAALDAAGLQPADIDYVEAHGTGTSLGDPIELQALAAALGPGRTSGWPLWIGSCKTNFGHVEAAAGIAGLVKTVAALRRRELPGQLHFRTPNPMVDWERLPLRVATALQPWPGPADRPARAGVSSFGFSGTNAHVILEEPPLPESKGSSLPEGAQRERPVHLLALSARDEPALRELARCHRELLADPPSAPADYCWNANTGRARLPHRLSVRGAAAQELASGLQAFADGRPAPGVVAGGGGTRPRIAFLFTGQGAQYAGMGRGLYDSAPVFRAALDRCAEVLDPLMPHPLSELIDGSGGLLERTACAQPATFAIEYALTRLWRSWGVEPALVLGHSLGEYVAACDAGVMPLEHALRVVVERGRICDALPGDGAMLAVFCPVSEVEAMVAARVADGAVLAIAAYNAAEHTVVSGARSAVEALASAFGQQGIRTTPLRISHGFHSPLVDPALAPLGAALDQVPFAAARVAIVSNVTGRVAQTDAAAHRDYWLRHLRAPVRFAESMQAVIGQGITHCIEIGPHPVLLGLAAEAPGIGDTVLLPSLRRGSDDWAVMMDALQRLYADGAPVDWQGFDQGRKAARISLPTYPFQRRRHWIDLPAGGTWLARRDPSADEFRHARAMVDTALRRQSLQGPQSVDLSDYGRRWEVLGELTDGHAREVLRGAGLFTQAGDRASLDAILQRLASPPIYRHLLQRWLQRIADSGDLSLVDSEYVAKRALPDPQLAARWAQADRVMADNPTLLHYLRHCGELLPAVIGGRESPLETLFPQGSFELAEGIYQHSAPMRYINGLAAGAVEALVAARGAGAPLRVLEIGAGTGGSSSAVIPMCPPDRSAYWYTDVTSLFFERAARKFADHGFMKFAEFDLERDPAVQGFALGSFDLVFAANAVHATRDLRQALHRIRELLAPGGMLLLIESTRDLAWYDMTTGLIEGWQHFADELRRDSPLLGAPVWIDLLRSAGFDDVAAWPGPGSAAEAIGQHVLVAWAQGALSAADARGGGFEPAAAPAPGAAGPVIASIVASTATVVLPPSPAAELRDRLARAVPDERIEMLREFVRDQVVQVLRLPAGDPVGRHDRLMDLGMDSLMAVQLRNRLGSGLGLDRPLPASLMFDHPTIAALADHLHARVGGDGSVPGGAHGRGQSVTAAAANGSSSPGVEQIAPAGLAAETIAAMSEDEVEAMLLSRLGQR